MSPFVFIAVPAFAAVLLFAAPAVGQVTQGGRIETHNKRAAVIEGQGLLAARNAARKFGICVAARERDRVETVLALPADNPELRQRLLKLATSACLREGTLKFPLRVLRGAFFEGMYLVKYGSAVKGDIAQAPPIDWTSPYIKPLSPAATVAVRLASLGECAARLRPDAARTLIMAQPGSENEQVSLDGLKGLLPTCVPKGLTMRLSTDILRGAVAEGLYTLSQRAPAFVKVPK